MSNFSAPDNNAVAEKDGAETFGESDVSLTTTAAEVTNGSVAIGPAVGTTSTPGSAGGSGSIYQPGSDGVGISVVPNNDLSGVEATIADNTDTFSEFVVTDTGGNVLASESGPFSAGDTVTVEVSLSSGATYYLIGYDDGATWDQGSVNTSFPYGSSDIDATSGVYNYTGDGSDPITSDSAAAVVESVTALKASNSGTAYIEWPAPTDIYAWDVGVYQFTPDGETVEVYVEEEQSGSWVEVAGPISRGDTLPADPSNNVRYRVELSRADPANDPTLDAIYRRFKL